MIDMHISESHDQNKIVREPCDVQYYLSTGDIFKAMVAVQQQYMDPNQLNKQGFNLLHYASSFNRPQVVIRLVQHFNIDVNIQSQTNQTPLMLSATSYNSYKVAQYLIEKGANLNMIDGVQFNAILYAVKCEQIKLMFYFIYKGVDFNIKDFNGCGLVHWSAYQNNVVLLQILASAGFRLNDYDLMGYTPFMRAVYNQSYQAIKFLIDYDPNTIPEGFDTKKLRSPSLQKLIRAQMLQKYNLPWSEAWFQQNLKENAPFLTRVFLIFSTVVLYYHYITGVIWRTYYDDDLFFLHVLFNFLVFAYIPYIQFFFDKVKSARNLTANERLQYSSEQKQSLGQKSHTPLNDDSEGDFTRQPKERKLGNSSKVNFKFLNEFLDKHQHSSITIEENKPTKSHRNISNQPSNDYNVVDDDEDQEEEELQQVTTEEEKENIFLDTTENNNNNNSNNSNNNINSNSNQQNTEKVSLDNLIIKTPLHKLVLLIDEGYYDEAEAFDFETSFCPYCVAEKPERTFHCSECRACVPEFSHHSTFFNKCINLQNYQYFYYMIFLQFFLLSSLAFFTLVGYWKSLTSYQILAFFEIFYLIINESLVSYPVLHGLLYLFASWLLFFSFCYVSMETYCAFNNLTREEFFNQQQLRYLYQERFVERRGGARFTYYKNQYDEGYIQNFCNRIF